MCPPRVKRHSKPNPYALTWEHDVIHYSVPVATFLSRFRVQRVPLIEMSRLVQTGCKSAHHASNATRNHIPMLFYGRMTSSLCGSGRDIFIQISSPMHAANSCLLYTSDAADEEDSVDL